MTYHNRRAGVVGLVCAVAVGAVFAVFCCRRGSPGEAADAGAAAPEAAYAEQAPFAEGGHMFPGGLTAGSRAECRSLHSLARPLHLGLHEGTNKPATPAHPAWCHA
jgi:hypothetical protein